MTDTKRVAGGVPSPAQAIVSADQVTIVGNGTSEDPLRAVSVPPQDDLIATYISDVDPLLGMAVVKVVGNPVAVQPGDDDGTILAAQVIGVIVAIDGDQVTVRTTGTVTLTTTQWDLVKGGSGGFTPGAGMRLTTDGQLRASAVDDEDSFFVLVGVALSSVTLLLSTPSVPIQVANTGFVNTFTGTLLGTPILGMAITPFEGGGFQYVPADASDPDQNQVVGVIVAFTGQAFTAQFSGVVTLPNWTAIAGTAALVQKTYYVSGTTAGHLTVLPPSGGGQFVSTVGFAISATKLLLSLPNFPTENP